MIFIIIGTWFCDTHLNVIFDVQKGPPCLLPKLAKDWGGGVKAYLGNCKIKSWNYSLRDTFPYDAESYLWSTTALFFQVKHWRGMNIDKWWMSDQLTVDTTSYIVTNLVPNVPYTFQVCARVWIFDTFLPLPSHQLLLIPIMFPKNVWF